MTGVIFNIFGRQIAFLAAFLAVIFPGISLAQEPILKVGVILPLTGDFASIGQALQQGMTMRLNESKDSPIRFLYEDDGTTDRKRAVSAFRKFTTVDDVDLMFTMAAPIMEPLLPLIREAKVPTACIWDYNPRLWNPAQYAYSIGFSNTIAGQSMAHLASKRYGLKSIAIVSAHDEWSEFLAQAFKAEFLKLGGEILVHEEIDISATDLRPEITRLKQKNAPAVFFPLYIDSFVTFVRQAKELHLTGLLLTGEGLTPNEAKLLGPAAEGLIYQRIKISQPGFEKRYYDFLGSKADEAHLGGFAMGYDAASFALAALAELGAQKLTLNSESMQKVLPKIKISGVSGPIDFSNFQGKTLANYELKNGQAILLDAND